MSGTVYLDETYYTVRMRDIAVHEDGSRLRGLSRNRICVGVATDRNYTICLFEGYGKPSGKKSYETFKSHIKKGSTLIHDKEQTHKTLVNSLELNSIAYSSAELKGLADKDNPMEPVNRVHDLLKKFRPVR